MLKYKFLFPLLVLVTFAIFSVGTLTFFRTSRELEATALVDMQRSTYLLTSSAETWIRNRHSDLKELSRSDIVTQSTGDSFLSVASRQVASKRLTEMATNSPFYNRFLLVKQDGTILAASGYAENENLIDEYKRFISTAWPRMTAPGQVESMSSWRNGVFHYSLCLRLFKEDKINQSVEALDGMLIADLNVQALIDSTFGGISFGHSGYAGLYDENGLKVDKEHAESLDAMTRPEAVTGHPADNIYFIDHDGGASVLVTKKLSLVPWTLGVNINKSEFTEPAYRIAYEIVLIGLIVTALTAALIMAFLNWVLRPIQNLAATAEAVTLRKDYSLRAKQYSNDELGMLVLSFNDMLKQIETRDHGLEDAAYKLELARDAAEEARNKAEVANQAKSEFLANMSHELRTPLNSIIGLTDVLMEEKMDSEHAEMVEIVKKSSTNLLEIVNDILDLSKIENMGMGFKLENIPFDFQKTVLEIIEVMAPLASQKGIGLTYAFRQDVPYLMGDPVRVKRILMNLVSNAVKYTPKGSVEVTVDRSMLPDGRAEVSVSVKDTGIGIPEEKFDRIFEKFTQADESTTRKFGGTGLGLTIAKNLAGMMGGGISLKSKVNVGSTFSFHALFAVTDRLNEEGDTAEAAISNAAGRIPLSKARILVAEDSELNRVYMKKLFSFLGAAPPDIASDGQEAVDMWKKNGYDIILMDCHMPKLNGYDAVAMIRAADAFGGRNVPIVAMTADALPGTREKCLASGMDEYISKPVDKKKFAEILGRWIEFPGKAAKEAAQSKNDGPPPVDLAHVREFSGGDAAAERQFVAVFTEETDRDIALLKQNLTDGVNKVWSETMHRLKNSFGLMGSESLRLLCEQGQHMLDATADARIALLDDVLVSYDDVREFLKKVYP
jgi:signal transduction histidine kinase/DNA-binding NarL/FixJ family response regulator